MYKFEWYTTADADTAWLLCHKAIIIFLLLSQIIDVTGVLDDKIICLI